MTAEQWQHVKELFQGALERDAGERAAFLDAACAGDAELRTEIEQLLASYNQSESFLESPVFQAAAKWLPEGSVDPVASRRIGVYEIVREIGRGGMGAVYLAVRADEQYRKRVAIKLVKPGMDSKSILHRFRQERQILASLDHPGIAKLLDGGTTEEGLPYVVMDYIEGLPITEYCDRHRLSTAERLTLFRTVCSAVHYAHRNLVVHRDIKPSNILVTTDGETKLLDFGIAKLLNPELVGETLAPTVTVLRLMTPEYASPEQVRGGPITTASDVYSLGAVLYELLTGHHAYRFTSRAPQEIERVICEKDPEKPSTAISREEEVTAGERTARITPEVVSQHRQSQPEKLRRRLSGDVDNIVLMAMRKEPERRYGSVEQFSDDLRRHLEGLPVMAAKDTLGYRAGKFIRRHTPVVMAAALVVLTLVGGIIATTWEAKIAAEQARIAAQERDKARIEAAKAERINGFLQHMLSSVDPNKQGREVTVAEVLDKAAKRVGPELANHPEIEAAVRSTLATTYKDLGLYNAAEPHARAALAIRQRLFGHGHPEIAQSLRELGDLLYEKGEYAEAETYLRAAVGMYRNLGEGRSLGLAASLDALGILLNNEGHVTEAEQLYREALALYRKLLEKDDERVANVLNDLAVLLGTKGALEEAERFHREALMILRQVYGQEHPKVATALYNLAGVLDAQGDYARSEPLFRQVLAMRRKLLGEEHPYVILTMITLANTLWLEQDYQRAEPLAREGFRRATKVLADGHPLTAYAHIVLGQTLCDGGRPREGERHLRQALRLRKKLLPASHYLVANTESVLGGCLVAQQRYQEAEPLLRQSYAKLKDDRGEKHEKTLAALQRLVTLYDAWGQTEQAVRFRAMLPKRNDP